MTDLRLLRAAIGDVVIEGDPARHRAAEEFGKAFGLVRANTSRICLARLTSNPCPRGTAQGGRCGGCGLGTSTIDHTAVWRRPYEAKPSVMTSQPHGSGGYAEQLANRFGLSLMVDPSLSWHSPGSTTLLVFDAQGAIQ